MANTDIALTIISVLGTVSSILFAFLAFRRNDKKDTKENGKNEGVILSEIGYIKSSIDRIEERYSNLSNRVVKVEESVANAHKRITEHLNDNLKHGGH